MPISLICLYLFTRVTGGFADCAAALLDVYPVQPCRIRLYNLGARPCSLCTTKHVLPFTSAVLNSFPPFQSMYSKTGSGASPGLHGRSPYSKRITMPTAHCTARCQTPLVPIPLGLQEKGHAKSWSVLCSYFACSTSPGCVQHNAIQN